jgi:hypothetical protein
MRSVVDRNVVIRRTTVNGSGKRAFVSMRDLGGEPGGRALVLWKLKDL